MVLGKTEGSENTDPQTPLPPVFVDQIDLVRLFNSVEAIDVSVYPTGVEKHEQLSFVRHGLCSIESAKTLKALVSTLRSLKSQFMESGLFREVNYRIEPAREGGRNTIVCLDFVESNGRKELGIHTDMKGKPEVKISMANVLNRACTIAFECMPTKISAGMTSVKSKLQWYNPIFGQLMETSWTQGTYDHSQLHDLDKENKRELSAAVHFGPSYNRHSLVASHIKSFCDSLTPDHISPSLEKFLYTTRVRSGVQYERVFSALQYHTHSILRALYAHPVQGFDLRLRGGIFNLEMFKALDGENSLAAGVGSRIDSGKEIRLEGFGVYHLLLHPLVTFGLWGKCGMFFPIHPWGTTESHALDRFFVGNSHVRGYRFIGPSEHNKRRYHDVKEYFRREKTSGPISQLGGSLYTALSSSLSFPIPVSGGLIAGHVFLNTGYLNDVCQKDYRCFGDWANDWCSSFGAGIILNQLPGLGALSAQRIEFNLSLPIVRGPKGCDKPLECAGKEVFKRLKFGLYWSSE
ncbi:Tob55 [Perkinsela sp. CCAP 1560/4]|nr:Tob55 [Perkinsela sp. CCAP 1560/4]|eukprot:KNH09485.1 Tob55 [Perkinsela sp. CCAP 1560/4]